MTTKVSETELHKVRYGSSISPAVFQISPCAQAITRKFPTVMWQKGYQKTPGNAFDLVLDLEDDRYGVKIWNVLVKYAHDSFFLKRKKFVGRQRCNPL